MTANNDELPTNNHTMTQESLQIAVFQMDSIWENSVANRARIDELLRKTDSKTDVVFLPEMFTTGFTLNAEKLAEVSEGETFNWMTNLSVRGNFAV